MENLYAIIAGIGHTDVALIVNGNAPAMKMKKKRLISASNGLRSYFYVQFTLGI